MAWTESKVFQQLFDDLLTQDTDVNLDTGVIKVALYGNDITPNSLVSATNSAYGNAEWSAVNEITSIGEWDAGGVELTNRQVTSSSGIVKFEADQVSSAPDATMTGIHGGLIYDSSALSVQNQGVCYSYFGGELTVSEGVFTVIWHPGGVFSLNVN